MTEDCFFQSVSRANTVNMNSPPLLTINFKRHLFHLQVIEYADDDGDDSGGAKYRSSLQTYMCLLHL
jgi:hypothetical protein